MSPACLRAASASFRLRQSVVRESPVYKPRGTPARDPFRDLAGALVFVVDPLVSARLRFF